MPAENSLSPNDERLSLNLRMLSEAANGRLDDLECPKCRQATVYVRFTHPTPNVYRTWFICFNCDFHSRIQNIEQPPFFSEERISSELEEKDLAILKQSIFKRPPLGPI